MRSIVVLRFLLLLAPLATAAAQNGPLVVRGLSFDGNKAFDDLTLSAAIATTNSAWIARSFLTRWTTWGEKRYLTERDVAIDRLRIEVVYKFGGYFQVRVDTIVERTSTDAKVTFKVDEGEPTRITSIGFAGFDSVPDRGRMLRDLPLSVGNPYSQYVINETTDTLASNRRLPPLEVGDLLAIRDTGAYGSVMASNYNRRPMAAEVLIDDHAPRLLRRRQTIDEMLQWET